jgi:hypothetical protein
MSSSIKGCVTESPTTPNSPTAARSVQNEGGSERAATLACRLVSVRFTPNREGDDAPDASAESDAKFGGRPSRVTATCPTLRSQKKENDDKSRLVNDDGVSLTTETRE